MVPDFDQKQPREGLVGRKVIRRGCKKFSHPKNDYATTAASTTRAHATADESRPVDVHMHRRRTEGSSWFVVLIRFASNLKSSSAVTP